MNGKNKKHLFILFVLMCITLVSCTEEQDNIQTAQSNIYLQGKDLLDKRITTNLSKIDTTTHYINTKEDLNKLIEKININYEEKLKKEGWVEVGHDFSDKNRAPSKIPIRVRVDTLYTRSYLVGDYDEVVKMRFSSEIVNEINSVVRPYLRISTDKTYVCEWRRMAAYYNLKDNEKAAVRESPNCALYPETRDGLARRGYKGYVHVGTFSQFQMISYQLWIKYENVDHKTTILDIDWPFFPNDLDGFEFIYAIATRVS